MKFNLTKYKEKFAQALELNNNKKHLSSIKVLVEINQQNEKIKEYQINYKKQVFGLMAVQYMYLKEYKYAKELLLECIELDKSNGQMTMNESAFKRFVSCNFNLLRKEEETVTEEINKIIIPEVHLFQIAYNEKTKEKCLDCFEILDNTENTRPDWREYWPIKNYLLNHEIKDDEWYGFFSPKFKEKTGLDEQKFLRFIKDNIENCDVLHFSPFYDHKILNDNIYLQCEVNHPGTLSCFKYILNEIAIDDNILAKPSSTNNFIYCNYFIAKGKIWKKWFELTEQIYLIAENEIDDSKKNLNLMTNHEDYYLPMKIFIIERIITLLVDTYKLNCISYPSLNLGISDKYSNEGLMELIMADSHREIFLNRNFKSHYMKYKEICKELSAA